MSIFNIFKKQQRGAALAHLMQIIRQMLEAKGLSCSESAGEGVFDTTVVGEHGKMPVRLICSENSTLTVLAMFPFPMYTELPDAIFRCVQMEVDRLEKTLKSKDTHIIFSKGKTGKCILNAITVRSVVAESSVMDIQDIMDATTGALEGENCESLMCAIFGLRTYDEVVELLTTAVTKNGGSCVDGYRNPREHCASVSFSRLIGRLDGFAAYIILLKASPETRGLAEDMDFVNRAQCAYDLADETERDVIRKLIYLICSRSEELEEQLDDAEISAGRHDVMTFIMTPPIPHPYALVGQDPAFAGTR